MGDSNDNSKDQADQHEDAGGEFWQFLKFFMASCLLTALVFWPYTFGQLAVVWEPEVVTDVRCGKGAEDLPCWVASRR